MSDTTYIGATARFASLLERFECSLDGRAVATQQAIDAAHARLAAVRTADCSVFIVGNGGSAAVAAHIQNDLVNKGRLRAQVLHEPSLLTCMSNDYGYESAFGTLTERYARAGDVLVAISSSGRSPNILHAVDAARRRGASVLGLSGFDADNPLRGATDIHFWCPSGAYGEVEIGHLFMLHHIADQLSGVE